MILDFLIRWAIHTVSLVMVVALIPGISVDRWEVMFVASLMLGFLNTFLKPLVIFFMLPLYIVTLGLITLVINGLMFFWASYMIKGFYVKDFFSAFLGAFLFSIISFLLNLLFSVDKKIDVRVHRRRFPFDKDEDVIDVEGKEQDSDYPKRRIPDL